MDKKDGVVRSAGKLANNKLEATNDSR